MKIRDRYSNNYHFIVSNSTVKRIRGKIKSILLKWKGESNMSKRVITIARQYGSNGRNIAKKLSERLGIHYYDKELIALASERSDISYEELVKVDEKRANPWRYPVDEETQMENRFRFEPLNDVLFATQAKVIRELAEQEECIIVGRCANYILRDVPTCRSVYLHASIPYRIQTIMDRAAISEKDAKMLLKKMDKQRKYYYNCYTDNNWNDIQQYHLCIDAAADEEEILVILETLYRSIK